MLRATSEIAVAIMVPSVNEKPSSRASWCPAWRAATMSEGPATSTAMSLRTVTPDRLTPCKLMVQQRKPFLQIQGGVHIVELEAQLDHGKGHLGLYTDDHGFRTAQPRHVRDRPQRPR